VFLRDAPALAPYEQGRFWSQFAAVFDFAEFGRRWELLLSACVATVYFISFNVYFLYLGTLMIYYMGFTAAQVGYLQGGGLIVAMLLAWPTVGLINRQKVPVVVAIALGLNVAGLWLLYAMARPGRIDVARVLSATNVPLALGVFLVGVAYVLVMQTVTVWVKQLYPEKTRGQFEGVRLVFFMLIPMLAGTGLGSLIVTTGAGTVTDANGITANIPTESIFFWAAWIALLAFVPLYFAGKLYYARARAVPA